LVPKQPVTDIADVSSPASVGSQASTGAKDRLPFPVPGNPAPAYPPELLRNRQEGIPILYVRINERGMVEEISLDKSSGFTAFDDSAMKAVRNWKFEPGIEKGKLILTFRMPVEFYIKNDRP
jgi:protein TonB